MGNCQYFCSRCEESFLAPDNQHPEERALVSDISELSSEFKSLWSQVAQLDTAPCPQCGQVAKKVDSLSRFMLQDRRDYIIQKVKAPLEKAILSARRLGEVIREVKSSMKKLKVKPTKENTKHPNSHVLLDMQDKFLQTIDNSSRNDLLRAIWQLIISEHEHDSIWRDWMYLGLEELVEEILSGRWQPRPNYRIRYGTGDINGIGYRFMKKCYQDKVWREEIIDSLQEKSLLEVK